MQEGIITLEAQDLQGMPLDQLAQLANQHHHAAVTAAMSSVQSARASGHALIQARTTCKHGEWLPWLADNFEASPRTAQAYMHVARNWEQLQANTQDTAHLTLTDALASLAAPRLEPASSAADPLTPAAERLAGLGEKIRAARLAGIEAWAKVESNMTIDEYAEYVLDGPTPEQYNRYRYFPDVTGVEYDRLKAFIGGYGLTEPVLIDEDGNVLDGHQRIRAWRDLQLEGRESLLRVAPYTGLTEEEKADLIFISNAQRMNITEHDYDRLTSSLRHAYELVDALGVDQPDDVSLSIMWYLSNAVRRHLTASQALTAAEKLAPLMTDKGRATAINTIQKLKADPEYWRTWDRKITRPLDFFTELIPSADHAE